MAYNLFITRENTDNMSAELLKGLAKYVSVHYQHFNTQVLEELYLCTLHSSTSSDLMVFDL
jgi:hypothetical protein